MKGLFLEFRYILDNPSRRYLAPNDGNGPSFWVKVTATRPVWFRVKRLREFVKTNDLTE